MDLPDGHEGLIAALDRAKEVHKNASNRKGQKATNKASRFALEFQFRLAIEQSNREGTSDGYYVSQTVIGLAYPPCALLLTELEPICIDDLRLETVHRGRVLIVRTFCDPHRVQSVQNAIEDGVGGADRLSVYNSEPGLNVDQILPKNVLLAIKEPYYKLTADGGYTIRVDHPTDLIRMKEDDTLVPIGLQPRFVELNKDEETPAYWKENCNKAFQAKDWRSSVDYYTMGLSHCVQGSEDMKFDLHRNRAIANIHLHRYEAGLADAEAAVIPHSGDPKDAPVVKKNSKAYYRAGCAAYHLQDYARAMKLFEKTKEITPGDEDATRELQRTALRLHEQSSGEYNFAEMAKPFMTMSKSFKTHGKRLDHANFAANVEIRKTVDKGRGLFAAKDIKTGELVLCEKAFCVAFDSDPLSTRSVTLNLNTNTMTMGAHTDRWIDTVHKLIHNPKKAKHFLQLYDGGYPRALPVVLNSKLVVDVFQTQAALEHNGFACPSVSDVAVKDPFSQSSTSTGVWLTPSAINHDCIGNVHRAFIGDMIVIHATKNIAKNEEVTFGYRNPGVDNEAFQKDVQKAWKFKCSCALCMAETESPTAQRKQRVKVAEKIEKFRAEYHIGSVPPSRKATARAENLRNTMVGLYDEEVFGRLPRIALPNLDLWLCMAKAMSGDNEGLRTIALSTLTDLGYDVKAERGKLVIDRQNCIPDGVAVHAAMYLTAAYLQLGQKGLSQQAFDFAVEVYKILFGSTLRFEERFQSGAG